ncbi:MAG: hypothetical protein QOG10_688 [Kribbellaceae bacterium]|nr:hypothetical protein [Kribbellaceae bacterium]
MAVVEAGVLIGLDVGTTSSKAVLYTTDGQTVAEGRAPTVWRSTPSGVEIDARDLLASAIDAVNQALGQTSGVAVLGLGVASMGESGVLLDRRGTPVAPVIAWHDSRDQIELAELDARLGADNFSARTGLPFRTQWSLTKHHWLVRHQHAVADAVRRLNISEWIVRGLGGEEASELSLASRTGWLDLATRTWWADSMSVTEMKESLLPPLVTAGTALGNVTNPEVPAALAGAVLTAAGHDHQAATVGVGAIDQGDELDSCGTAEALLRTVQPNLSEHAVGELARAGVTTGWHVLPDRWCLLGGTEGGRTLQRVRALLGEDGQDLDALDRAALASLPSDVAGLVLEVTSEGIAIRGADQLTRPEHIWRSALEHVTREAQVIHGEMSGLSGRHRRLVVTGGWSNSRGLMHIKRDMLGPLERSEVSEAGCRGAALLAGLAAGVYETTDQFPAPRLARA